MKNNTSLPPFVLSNIKKHVVILFSGIREFKKIALFCLFYLLSHVVFLSSIQAQSLNSEIVYELKNESLSQGLSKLGELSYFKISYSIQQVSKYTNISVPKAKRTVATTLQLLLANTNLTYKVKGLNLMVFAKDDSVSSGKNGIKKELLDVRGRIVGTSGDPIPGVSISVKGENRGTFSDSKGYYEIKVYGDESVLVFSQLGLKRQDVEIRGRKEINIIMLNNEQALDQVVVTGIFSKKASTFTGSAITVTAKELEMNGNRNIVTTLRNIDPSFNIIENSLLGSDPNRTPEIQIRGNSSVPNITELKGNTRVDLNTPLVVIDGFESSLRAIMDMNENEVEMITILKDASATAIYGSRGANGVVVITTKAPKSGKLKITYNGRLNVETPDLSGYRLLKSREKLDLEYKVGMYNEPRAEADLPLKRYYNFLLNEVNSGVETDWLALPLRTGLNNRHNVRIEGGDDKFRYSASAQINLINGVMKGSSRNSFNGTINLLYNYRKLKFSNQTIIGSTNSANSPYGNFEQYAVMNPYWRPYDSNGKINKFLGNSGNDDHRGVWGVYLPTNPLYNATLNTFDRNNLLTITNNFSIDWKLFEELSFRMRVGVIKGIGQSDRFRPAEHTAFASYSSEDILRRGDYYNQLSNSLNYDASMTLNYNKIFSKRHLVSAGFDYNIRQAASSDVGYLVEGFSNSRFDFPSMALQYAKNSKPSGSESLSRAIGLTSSVNYSFDNRYYADLSFRTDGSSLYGSNKRFAPFWSTGIGWNLHQENFMNLKNSKSITRLRLRGSVGTTGSQAFNSYQSLSTYRYHTNDRYYGWMGAYLLSMGNENLSWQKKTNYNVGLDAEFLHQRIIFSFDAYKNITKDLVSSIDLAPSNGFSSYVENVGEMSNQGFESKISVYIVNNPRKQLLWNVNASFVQNKNKIILISQAMKDAQQKILDAGGAVPSTLYLEGYSSNTLWVVPSLGIDPSTGKEIFLDNNNEPTFFWSSKYIRDSGSTEPKLRGNFGSVLKYKNITLNMSFRYELGGKAYNQTLINKVENANYKYNMDSRVYFERWQNPGDIAAFKSRSITSATQLSSRFVQNANTLVCQDINLQYELRSRRLMKALGLEYVNFVTSIDELFYLSTIKRERGTQYPFSRTLSVGLTAVF